METESRQLQDTTVVPCEDGQDGIGSLVVGFLMGAGVVGLIWAVASQRPVKPDLPDNRFLGHWEYMDTENLGHLVVTPEAGFMLKDLGSGLVEGGTFVPYFDSPTTMRMIGPTTESKAILKGDFIEATSGSGRTYRLERARSGTGNLSRK